jgi:hypothetical protein
MATTSDTAVLGHASRCETEHIHEPGTGSNQLFHSLRTNLTTITPLHTHRPQLSQPEPNDESDFFMDEDLFDEIADDEAPGLGILVRTDFSSDEAWGSFLAKLKEGEEEYSSSAPSREEDTVISQDEPSASASASAPASGSEVEMDDDKDGSDGSSDQDSGLVIAILDPSPEILPYFSDISNLTALRLLNDVDLRRLVIPPNAKRFNPPNPIVDYDGWQEIYHGKTLWIYDAKSNQDQCARLVSKRSDFYGTAT